MLERFLKLEKTSIEAAHLLYLTYFLAPDYIPYHILQLLTKSNHEKAIEILRKDGFLQAHNEGYVLPSEIRSAIEHYLQLNRTHEKKYRLALEELIKVMSQELVADRPARICPQYLKQAEFLAKRMQGMIDVALLSNLEDALSYFKKRLAKNTYNEVVRELPFFVAHNTLKKIPAKMVANESLKEAPSSTKQQKSPPPIRWIKPNSRSRGWGAEEIAGAVFFFGLLGGGAYYLHRNTQGGDSTLLDKVLPAWKLPGFK